MSNPVSPTTTRSWSKSGAWSGARLIAVGYLGLNLAVALANEIAGHPSVLDPAMALISFPGAILILVALFYPLALLLGDTSGTEETGFSILTPLFHGAGALVNVLIVWGVIVFVRHFRNEADGSRGR
ncbi:hypothetical protein ABT001_24740 [Streptomyces sp. NPDC002793]|uniref:hypothetical protein n=1 Tax=Streptomyces sp. NPDC002793 TaxID=3154432 RepID=UPI00331A5DE9